MGSESRKKFLPLDPVTFSNESKAVIDFIADYYENVEKYPVQSTIEPGYLSAMLPDSAPYFPEPLQDILEDRWRLAWRTCEAAVCVLATARDKALKELGGWENITKLVVYASDQTYFTFQKAAKLVGIPPSNFRLIETFFSIEFLLSPEKLRFAIEEDIKSSLVPLFLCATIGTTPSGAVAPIAELGKVAMGFKLWLHIDAAYEEVAVFAPSSAIILMEWSLLTPSA
ncbi:hypothetical protein PVK06_049254 [Gossypium arboreum]|uniref:Uncharacterized protein n=1 Tax=Gossypium arboreum TaxID=29729 RepID=A0ABR0MK52_GOSAR|nr:hypothetical protein PVK06_049254 [Gossypium arboreum]